MAYMPSFFAWLFRPAFKDNKVISSFSTFLRLLLSFFDIPRIISRFSESLDALRFLSLLSAPLFFFSFQSLLVLSAFLRWSLSPLALPSSLLFSLLLFLIHLFSLVLFLFLSHLTFPASFSYFLRLFSLFSLSFQSLLVFSASHRCSLRLFSFFFLSSIFLSSFTPSHLLFLISPSLSLPLLLCSLLLLVTWHSLHPSAILCASSLLVLSVFLRCFPIILWWILNNATNSFSWFLLPRQCYSSVETRLSLDKLLILNNLSVKPYLFPDKLLILCQPISVISRLSVKPHLLPDKMFV